MGEEIEIDQQIKTMLAENHACYVLITCDEPQEDGRMLVEMSYSGDATMASYLIQGAQAFIDRQMESAEETEQRRSEKIYPLDSLV